ncbi:MAG: hypothetical protein A2161_02040 [Candidatus Schekmanbacteria bacterium RBG_13_48_7]|uniref:Thil AANH domain-containing protein n=1 Tax=Candidatus Schekmanbacteria bacterium RBG_13_48_7 TaxID=1817878 RepID=A0A1F7RWJ9_9BACT|nr:MAG: hypothetical protein A2161_02040 [Candidatus Schekmanbacteria bacterium RBG_13_48_7]
MEKKKSATTLMYSGGLDSTVTALTLAEQFERVILVTYHRGYGHWFINRSSIRVAEMEKHLNRKVFTVFRASVKDLFKKVVLDTFIADFKKYKALFIVCVGCKMAMHARTVIYNLENGIPYTSDGASKTTEWMPDQMPVTLERYKRLHNDYGIIYSNPVYEFGTRDQAREKLRQSGLSMGKRIGNRDFGTQPFCFYGDIVSQIRETFHVGLPLKQEYIVEFMEKKRPILDEYIQSYFKKKGMDIGALKAKFLEQ